MKKIIQKISLLFLLALAACHSNFVEASGATLYLSPNSGTFFVDSTFDVSIFVNTGGESINAIKTELRFDPKKLQITNPTAGKSFISLWVDAPYYSNANGIISFQGGLPTPGIKTDAGLVSTISFRAIAPGETRVDFMDTSQVLLDDGKGTNVLNSRSSGIYLLTIVPPAGPEVFSNTHFDKNKWYKDNNPSFSWKKEEGVTDFSYSLDLDSQGVPDNISEGDKTSVSFSDLEDGIWYFHIKAKKEGVWGGTSHYVVMIDRNPPATFSIEANPASRTSVSQPIVMFTTTDSLSGFGHSEIKIIDITSGKNMEKEAFFFEASSPYKLPSLGAGKYMIVARAYDKAGNWRDESANIEIYPRGIFYDGKGLWVEGYFISNSYIFLLLILLLLLIIILMIYLWRRSKKYEENIIKRYKEKEQRMIEDHQKIIDQE